MALRAAILSAAIKEIPSLSFTRAALSAGFSSIPPTVVSSLSPSTLDPTARDAVIDTLFGSDSSASRALVEAWEAYGANEMSGVGTGSPKDRVRSALSKRLEWSAGVGEHLVEVSSNCPLIQAYALLSTASAPSVPVPPAVLKTLEALRALRVPKYTPPALVARAAGTVASRHAESVLEETGDRLPLPTINPLAPLAYGWRIADTAVYAASPDKGRVGVMREPLGAGVEWYTGRVGLAAAYLSAGGWCANNQLMYRGVPPPAVPGVDNH